MKLDFDIDSIRSNQIKLLDCQVDLILRSLEFYTYTYKFIYPRVKEAKTKEENLRICLVRDTYHQIYEQFEESKYNNKIDVDNLEEKNFLKKVA